MMSSRALGLLGSVCSQDVFLGTQNPHFDMMKDSIHQRLQALGVEHDESLKHAHAMASREHLTAKHTDWDKVEHSFINEFGQEIFNTTYLSPKFKMRTGTAHFTWNPSYHMPFPEGDYTGLHNSFRVIDGDGNDNIPLTEVYLHHWLVGTQTNPDPLHYCEGDYFWGYGAEMRRMTYDVPKGYGVKRIGAKGYCGANLHFIRTDDLADTWKGRNDPKGNHGAAIKNCVECGYAPHRAPECLWPLDGTFGCCFTGSRCPVNNPKNNTMKEYRLSYNVVWTRDVSSQFVKNVHGLVLDATGGAIEINIKPKMKNSLLNTKCDDKVCATIETWTVDHAAGFGNGICPGTLLWGYLHQHVGAINGSLFINDKFHCVSLPTIGTDPNNAPGNEKGFVVAFSECVNADKLGNAVRLNKGDRVRVESYYDVDVDSTKNLPLPGGGHGGTMALFFAMMDCDPGTFSEIYVCRQSTCIPTFDHEGKDLPGAIYKTLGECEQKCN